MLFQIFSEISVAHKGSFQINISKICLRDLN